MSDIVKMEVMGADSDGSLTNGILDESLLGKTATEDFNGEMMEEGKL